MKNLEDRSVDEWSLAEVSEWLRGVGLESLVSDFEGHEIDGKVLLLMTEEDVRGQPLRIGKIGPMKKLILALKKLHNQNQHLVRSLTSCNDHILRCNPVLAEHAASSCNHNHWEHRSRSHGNNQNRTDSVDPDYWSSQEDDDDGSPARGSDRSSNGKDKNEMKPEAWKAIVAMAYFFCVTWITAFVMVFVHDRVPDMATYPPLPDIFLDSVPLIPWAFQMCELCGLILFLMWCSILIFHKHRFILLRRMFSLFGSVFLLRCVTMLITSLSVPGRHLECKARPYGSWSERLHQAFLIWTGGGMSLQGVRTCGDYMFSGHTVVLTLLNFFITEYTPPTLYFIHTLSWVLNLFGIFFILAGHEHYSIDVFIAFYISTRLFLYYHTLANTRALYQPDRQRTKVWFPLFSFFESGVRDIVPNHFEHHACKFKHLARAFTLWRHKLKAKHTE